MEKPLLAKREAIRRWWPAGRRAIPKQELKPSKRGASRFRNLAPRGLSSPISDVMTKDPVTCAPATSLRAVARMMIDADCGAVPVVENETSMKPVAIVTDRDIVCRAVANEDDLSKTTAVQCMSSPLYVLGLSSTLQDCCDLMKETQVHRVVVVDDKGRCCGIVSTCDIVKNVAPDVTSELLNDICEPIEPPSREDTRGTFTP